MFLVILGETHHVLTETQKFVFQTNSITTVSELLNASLQLPTTNAVNSASQHLPTTSAEVLLSVFQSLQTTNVINHLQENAFLQRKTTTASVLLNVTPPLRTTTVSSSVLQLQITTTATELQNAFPRSLTTTASPSAFLVLRTIIAEELQTVFQSQAIATVIVQFTKFACLLTRTITVWVLLNVFHLREMKTVERPENASHRQRTTIAEVSQSAFQQLKIITATKTARRSAFQLKRIASVLVPQTASQPQETTTAKTVHAVLLAS